MPPNFRTAVEHRRFAGERDAIIPHPVLADHVLQRVIQAICRRPEIGKPTDLPDVWAVTLPSSPLMPAVVIYYTFDAERIDLWSITRADPDAEEWVSFFL